MKPKTMILMVVAVVCGLGASYMTSRLLAERDDKPAEAAVVEKVTLLVAKKNLEIHTPFKKKPEDFFKEKQFTLEDAPKDALKPEDIAKLKDKYLKRGLRKDDHILPDDVVDNPLALKDLPVGMRAIGIPVNAAISASGWANLPGSHVDIFWTRQRGGSEKDTFAKLLLEDVIVLAADTNDKGNGTGAMLANVVTVALHVDNAMKLSLAMDTGTLRLVLRNLDDKSSSERSQVTMDELMKSYASKKAESVALAEATRPVEPPPEVKEPEKPVVPEPLPEVKLTKMTTTIRNGSEVVVRYYWVNDNDEIVGNPEEPVSPPPAPAAKKDDKKKVHIY